MRVMSIEKYDPPLSRQALILHGRGHLLADPVHAWRADTGIELIHEEPTREELERIWKNWNLMSAADRKQSDRKSLSLFGLTNAEHYELLRDRYPLTN